MTLLDLKELLETQLQTKIQSVIALDELTMTTQKEHLLEVVSFLQKDPACQFDQLIDITAVDYPEREERFEVVYHFLSHKTGCRVRLKISVKEGESVPSLVGNYPSACWWEREAWDMFGLLFDGAYDHRRLLTDYGFEGHPLRKDFPVSGRVEVTYDQEEKKVVTVPVSLPQEAREFDFESPWEGVHDLFKKEKGTENEKG